MPRKLKDLYVRMIGLVDKGANQEAMIAIAKRDDTVTTGSGAQIVVMKMDCPQCGKPYPSQQELDAHMAQEHDAHKALETVQAELATVTKELEALKGGGDPVAVEPFRAKYEEVTKELEDSRRVMKQQLEAANKELEESRTEVVKITQQRRRERFIKRAQELADLPGAPADDFAEILDHIQGNKVSDKEFGKINQLLTSWNVIVKKSKMFDEIGQDGVVAFSGPEGQLMALAREKQATDGQLTYAKAYARVLDENPGIYRAYLKEREGK